MAKHATIKHARRSVLGALFLCCFLLIGPVIFSGCQQNKADTDKNTTESVDAFDESTPSLVPLDANTNENCVEYVLVKGQPFCSTTSVSVNADDVPVVSDKDEKLNLSLVFDDRPWKAGWSKIDDAMTMIEYTVGDETVLNWHELITSQFYSGLHTKTTPKKFATMITQQIEEQGYNVETQAFVDTPTDYIFDFKVTAPEPMVQHEIQRIFSNDKGIYALHYVIKEPSMTDETRDAWITRLEKATVK